MATAASKRGRNEPEPPTVIIVKKVTGDGHGGHHGGAWKVAYADFVTAMMAFFLLLWILGATTEKQRKGIADYFTPTVVQMRDKSAGSFGPFGGDTMNAKDKYPHKASAPPGVKTIRDASSGGPQKAAEAMHERDRARFAALRKQLMDRIQASAKLRSLARSIRFTETAEGLRIDLVDQADFAMFGMGNDVLLPAAATLMGQVAQVIEGVPNAVIVRGHTDALPYAAGRSVNNWTLSSARAEATRKALADNGVAGARFARIEGVADREPFVPTDAYDPRNRRMSITLAWSAPAPPA